MLNVLLPFAMMTLALSLALQPELRLAVPLLVGVTAAMTMLLACLLYLGEKGRIALSWQVIITGALAMRLLFLFAPPQLSDDLYRYLWDALNLLNGINPYAAAPAVVTPPPELTALHSQINHPQYVTIYPPAAQLLFAGGAALGGTLTGLKGLLVALDLGLCALLVVMLKRLELPLWRAALYAWHPLPLLEIAASGHVDGTGMALVMASFALLAAAGAGKGGGWRVPAAGGLLAAAGLVKLFPVALVPPVLAAVPRQRRWLFVAGGLAGVLLLVVPFLPSIAAILGSLDSYARHWEFSGFAFRTLRAATGSGTIARLVLIGLFLGVVGGSTFRLFRRLRTAGSPAERLRATLTACYGVALAFLLLTPTLHPWYALCLAALLPFSAGPAGLTLCWSVFLAYQVQLSYFIEGNWQERAWVAAAVFGAPVAAWLLGRMTPRR
ncbi:hypothetical protein [Trichlorobacter ammonificans]|uniref:DUF2029 domain-containing protein n=1 Tax=Trichlorobacter ammonificans TaxID=2916410 RepID=A0ABM9D9R7_9BACT|nr:hypothetical protein [Trichlorobacter ammonificans]CAH2031973.1 conserved membrane protein of unknown function [Trichlorobacter ammonificans]